MSKSKNAPGSDIAELYFALIKKGNPVELLPFLEKYALANKVAFRQEVKKARKYWFEYVNLYKESSLPTRGEKYGPRATKTQQDIIVLSAIAVLDKSEIMRWDEAFNIFNQLHEPLVSEIIEWARPTWLNAYFLTQLKKSEWAALNYIHLRTLADRQLVEYDPELFVLPLARFPSWAFHQPGAEPMHTYIEYITQDVTAYQRDVPLLFEYETAIQGELFERTPGGKYAATSMWEIIFSNLLAQNKMDRGWFFENCMLVQTKEWNASLRSFFRRCLDAASPTSAELLACQYPLFACLHATSNVVANFAVAQIRKIWNEDAFDFQSFTSFVEPVMMRTDCKGSIRHILSIFDKAAELLPAYRSTISHLAADVFVIPDLALQERALKTLKKLGDANDPLLADKLTLYVPQMQGNIPEMLGPLLQGDISEGASSYEDYHPETMQYAMLREDLRVPEFRDWNELLFHFGKFIQSSEVIDAERLLDAFVTKRQLFPADACDQLETYAEQLGGLYFVPAHKSLISRCLIHIIREKDGIYKPPHTDFQSSNAGRLMKSLIDKVQRKIAAGSELPLLCFPTHLPHTIDPSVLIDRLIAYDEAHEEVDPVDFVIAISRTRRENIREAVAKARRLPQHYQHLVAFILGTIEEIPMPEKPSVWKRLFKAGDSIDYVPWAVAARTFYPDRVFPEFEHTDLKDVVNVVAPFKPSVQIDVKKNSIQNHFTKQVENFTTRRLVATLPKKAPGSEPRLLYSADIFEVVERRWEVSLDPESVLYWHSVMPQNDQALASYLLRYNCEYSEAMVHENLRVFLQIASYPNFRFTETVYYVIACCCVYKDSGLRNFASEVLLFLIENRRIDIKQLGEKLARLIFEGFAPLQRFLEVAAPIRDHSAVHNGALTMLLQTILEGYVPEHKLPTGFKKLLEVYFDLLNKTKQTPAASTLQNLAQLPQSASLKQIVNQLQSISQK